MKLDNSGLIIPALRATTKNNLNPTCVTLGNKKIKVVDDHQYALLVWGKLFQETGKPTILVSIDYHPDTNPPFWLYAFQKSMAIDPDREEILVPKFQNRIMAFMDPLNLETIKAVMGHMRNDEHINTAMALGYLKDYHMINCMEKHKYPLGHHYLVAIKDFGSLEDRMFADAEFSIKTLEHEGYILDIDLDYFSTLENFEYNPEKCSVFKNLVRGASLITVARSEAYFEYLKKENFTVEMCEAKLVTLLKEILKEIKEDMF